MKQEDRILSVEHQLAIIDKYTRKPLSKILERYLKDQDKISFKVEWKKLQDSQTSLQASSIIPSG